MRIAVLGAGSAGICTALELAHRGYAVDLYDETAQPCRRASRNNEGKIHLGLVYAKDQSLATARRMIEGAVWFQPLIERWLGPRAGLRYSTPFYYAVPHDTMTAPDRLEQHYANCQRLLNEALAHSGQSDARNPHQPIATRLDPADWQANFSEAFPPHLFQAVYRTTERAVDVRALAELWAAAVDANPCIHFHPNTVIRAVRPHGPGLRVEAEREGRSFHQDYDQVANTLWHGRLEIDSTFGLQPERTWIYRYKMGGWINTPAPQQVPSVTYVLGPYGDIVNLGERGVYFSWYPAGMVGTSLDVKPPDWESQLRGTRQTQILRESYEAVCHLCPALGRVPFTEDAVRPAGGVIFAWGETDIDHQQSRLHTRHEIGVQSFGGYHTVNTGKLTTAPLLGYQTANRILGLPGEAIQLDAINLDAMVLG